MHSPHYMKGTHCSCNHGDQQRHSETQIPQYIWCKNIVRAPNNAHLEMSRSFSESENMLLQSVLTTTSIWLSLIFLTRGPKLARKGGQQDHTMKSKEVYTTPFPLTISQQGSAPPRSCPLPAAAHSAPPSSQSRHPAWWNPSGALSSDHWSPWSESPCPLNPSGEMKHCVTPVYIWHWKNISSEQESLRLMHLIMIRVFWPNFTHS